MNYSPREQGDHVCSYRTQWSLDNPVRGWIHPPARLFGEYVKPGMTVADVGCGVGFFTLPLARMVGANGRVIGVDLQPEALARIDKKAQKRGLHRIVETRKCDSDDIGALPPLDFALSFYMAHETPDLDAFFKRMARAVKSGGLLLLAEPHFHVRYKHFEKEVTAAERAGFAIKTIPSIRFSHAALLTRT